MSNSKHFLNRGDLGKIKVKNSTSKLGKLLGSEEEMLNRVFGGYNNTYSKELLPYNNAYPTYAQSTFVNYT